ncbi:TetR/AcrR family transcriptional regulator [Actinomycetes bacterium M1A6_2h]
MPRNRLPQDRAEKRTEIVTAATLLFADRGYEQTPMAQIARAAGVTPNTIYWYFRDKDDVLIAVLDDVVGDAVQKYVGLTGSMAARILWVVTQLEQYHRLVDTVHSRTSSSESIDNWHNGFHSNYEALLTDELRREGVADADLIATTKVVVFVVEAMLTHPLADDEKAAMVDVLLRGVGCSQPNR